MDECETARRESYVLYKMPSIQSCMMLYYPAIYGRPGASWRCGGASLSTPFLFFPMHLLALNKPFGTICQFSPHETRASLADWVRVPDVYPAGRLDSDSEGLLLLTDDGALQARIAEPRHKLVKRYWAQVEGAVDAAALKKLARGVDLGDYVTRPCRADYVEPTDALWTRTPAIRFRAAIPTTWIELSITEGKNRQVRRMTAAVGFPTLRLVRVGIGALDIFSLGLQPGESVELPPKAPWEGIA
ncbi:23S rRNA pseudouridine2457 synthase [Paraburkholderia sp. BL6665CI2N2]|nr:23S rRNA pseudouridine2457 synthase [Paraburkholderia sp. BL6665CI2N2]